MNRLKNTFAIGCLVQWYEIEIFEEYIETVTQALSSVKNKENVIVDIFFNMAQNLEKIDESQMSLNEIFKRFTKMRDELSQNGVHTVVKFYPNNIAEFDNQKLKPYTIADYRREFNDRYCEKVDVLMWGETDSLIPRQTFEILDNLHTRVKDETPKYITFFSVCKMWDESWKILEHSDFTDKPFIENDYDNWWSLKYTMNQDEMEKINEKVTDLDIQVTNQHKFNGCGLVIPSEVVKSGVNIPRSVFFVHEDTAFMLMIQKVLGMIPQYIIKNILLVHNRNHPNKRMYVEGERTDGTINEKRRSNEWYVKANKMSEHNTYNLFNQTKTYTWEDVYE
tara:strand:- start:483 stop:1490 length:1008 start_codon:yes stop_codon:yes gene_type:complete